MMIGKSTRSAAIAALLLVLIGCDFEPRIGTVIEKRHVPSRITIQMMPMPVGKTIHYRPQPMYHSERWELTVRRASGTTFSASVSEGTYNAAAIGGYYAE